MASAKKIYAAGVYRAGMYAAGVFRGTGAAVETPVVTTPAEPGMNTRDGASGGFLVHPYQGPGTATPPVIARSTLGIRVTIEAAVTVLGPPEPEPKPKPKSAFNPALWLIDEDLALFHLAKRE